MSMNGKQLLDAIHEGFEEHAEEKLSTEELRIFVMDTVRRYLDETRELVLSTLDRAQIVVEEVEPKAYYCSKCGRSTPHVEVPPEGNLGAALECVVCHMTWDANDDLTEEDYLS